MDIKIFHVCSKKILLLHMTHEMHDITKIPDDMLRKFDADFHRSHTIYKTFTIPVYHITNKCPEKCLSGPRCKCSRRREVGLDLTFGDLGYLIPFHINLKNMYFELTNNGLNILGDFKILTHDFDIEETPQNFHVQTPTKEHFVIVKNDEHVQLQDRHGNIVIDDSEIFNHLELMKQNLSIDISDFHHVTGRSNVESWPFLTNKIKMYLDSYLIINDFENLETQVFDRQKCSIYFKRKRFNYHHPNYKIHICVNIEHWKKYFDALLCFFNIHDDLARFKIRIVELKDFINKKHVRYTHFIENYDGASFCANFVLYPSRKYDFSVVLSRLIDYWKKNDLEKYARKDNMLFFNERITQSIYIAYGSQTADKMSLYFKRRENLPVDEIYDIDFRTTEQLQHEADIRCGESLNVVEKKHFDDCLVKKYNLRPEDLCETKRLEIDSTLSQIELEKPDPEHVQGKKNYVSKIDSWKLRTNRDPSIESTMYKRCYEHINESRRLGLSTYPRDPTSAAGADADIDTGTDDMDAGDADAGDMASGDADTGDIDTGDADAGDMASGDMASGDMASGDADTGDADTGDMATGDMAAVVASGSGGVASGSGDMASGSGDMASGSGGVASGSGGVADGADITTGGVASGSGGVASGSGGVADGADITTGDLATGTGDMDPGFGATSGDTGDVPIEEFVTQQVGGNIRFIVDPTTNNKYSIKSKKGIDILKKYIKHYSSKQHCVF